MYIKSLFFLFLVFILFVVPFLHLSNEIFGIFGGLHMTAFLYSFIAVFFLFDSQIKKVFGRAFRYLVVGFLFLTLIHLSEIIFETWGLFSIDEEVVELIEHVLYGMGMLFFGVVFYMRSLLVEAEHQNVQQDNADSGQ